MPFEDYDEDIIFFNKLSNAVTREQIEEEPSVIETAGAYFRQENIIGSFVNRKPGLPNGVNDQSFNPYDYFTAEEKRNEKFISHAAFADNEDEINAVRAQFQQETNDRETIQQAGFMGAAVGFPIMMADLTMIPIGGAFAGTYKAGNSILKSGMVTGTLAASESAVTEAALHNNQMTRSFGESAINISASMILGGALGAFTGSAARAQLPLQAHTKEVEIAMNVEPRMANGENTVLSQEFSDLSAGAMEKLGDVQISGKAARTLAKLFKWDPLTTNFLSNAKSTRKITAQMFENPFAMDGGVTNAIETVASLKRGYLANALDGHYKIYRQYKSNGGKLRELEFNKAVSRALRNGDKSDIPEAAQSAKTFRQELYDPIRNEAIEVNLLPEGVGVSTAISYLNRRWDKDAINTNLPQFISKVSDWLKSEDVRIRAEADAARTFEGPMTKQQRLANEKVIRMDEAKKSDARYDAETGIASADYYEDLSDRISQRISINQSLPYDWKIGDGSTGYKVAGVQGVSGVFKERVFNIPDNLIEEFLENDIETLAGSYARQTAIDIEMMRRFETTDLNKFNTEIAEEYTTLMKNAKTDNERRSLAKQSKGDQDRLQAMYERIRGVYQVGDPDNVWVRAGRVARNLNYMRFMGGIVASSIPDIARIFMAEGFGRTFSKGLAPLVTNLKAFKMSAKEARQYGIGAELLLQGRSKIIADIDDYTRGGTKFERGVQSMTDKFGRINLMDYWTSGVKQMHAVVMQNGVIDDLLKGVVDPRLKRLGITDTDATLIAEQLKKHADKSEGVWLSNARNWDDPNLERKWGAMIAKESRRVIVEPGQERPLFMSSELGKTIGQFRSFMFSSTQRMTIATLQGQDRNAVGGVLTLISLGMLTYAFKQWDADRELSDDPAAWLAEGIDRSGVLGSIMEINNTVEKASSNGIGLRPLLGIEAPASRFVSRSMAENLMGPTMGSLLENTIRVMNAGLTPGDWTEADTRAMRRLLPYQNLSFIRRGLDRIEEEVGDL